MRDQRRFGGLAFSLIAMFVLFICPAVHADTMGSLQVDSFAKSGYGVQIQAHYTLDANPCCPAANIRWIQLIQLTDNSGNAKTFMPEFPYANFIDPRPGQDIGSPSTGDDAPWYDVTYNSATDTTLRRGSGPYFYDKPSFLAGDAPMRFTATTLVVCVTPADSNNFDEGGSMTILGGFTWGFTLTGNPAKTTPIAPTAVTDNAALRTAFNNALQNNDPGNTPGDFPEWTVAANTGTCSLTVYVPLPGALPGGLVILSVVAVMRRKGRLAA
ncbi:MAG TPA: hypothetical protein VG722_05070 [Tepidisphaeraceae bacterium]|nr:hypothetical protein [Tepidisphaeraceae bacterium]